MDDSMCMCQPPATPDRECALEEFSVVCVGADARGHRHIVHSQHAGVVAFLCSRWRPASKVVRVEDRRRHPHVCHTCYKAWERLSKERAA